MNNIQSILVPTDFSDTARSAFIYALSLADVLKAEIHLLHCVHPGVVTADASVMVADLAAQLVDNAEQNMQDFIEAGLAGVSQQISNWPSVKHTIEIGAAVPATKYFAKDHQIDLVIMGTDGAHSTWEELFGTLASGVLMNAPCPVLIVPRHARFRKYSRFCYATDLKGFDVLSGTKLINAFSPLTPNLHFLHINNGDTNEEFLDIELIESLYDRQKVNFRVSISAIKSSDVPAAIVKEAENMESDLIVMTRAHYNVFDRLFHRSFTREVAMHTHLPLLVINE